MKKRPREESDIHKPQNRRALVNVYDVGENKVSLTTPPIKASKRPREDSGVVHIKDDTCERMEVFKFRVLLPNGTSVELKMSEQRNEIPIEKFIDMVKKEYDLLIIRNKRRIIWEFQDLYFTDAYSNKIRIKVDFREFTPIECNLLWLHDGSAEADEYEDMWDLTPDTDLLKELPDDYTCETALADLIDNSLQALWSNGAGEKRLISVELNPKKISIFDSGPGMDGANGNIVKWGKMGASLHRTMREKAVGGEPPYLMPFFGMFGYGGPVATMCLGRRAVVSSKTKRSKKVFTLHMEREALVNASQSENCWKTKGGVRDPTKDEKLNSPHGSFTKVEIFGPKPIVKNSYIKHLRCKLKDMYFPYIQCDEVSGKTSRPVEFKVNQKDLAEIQGGEVATTNLHSCNGPEFVVQLHFSIIPGSSSMAGQNQRVLIKANARLKCVYFPIVEGKESMQRILDELHKDGCEIRESFDSFSRVSVRRLGRLLPDTRWALLPFMEPKQSRGEKAQILRRLHSRVKCFIDTDSGFNPTPHKTDLAHHHPYTKALKNFGNRSPEDEKVVQVEITRDGKKLSLTELQKLYHAWVSEMHGRYDVETDDGLDEPTIVVVSSRIEKLDLDSKVLRVHRKIQRKGRCWTAGQNIKVLKGACPGCHRTNVYATLEYIIFEGLEGEGSGEARLICRPLGLPEGRGCCLSDSNTMVNINGSSVFPIRIIDCGKCIPVDDIEWGKKIDAFNQKLPAAIHLLSPADCQELEIDGGLPISVKAGDATPENIVAVIRPKSFFDYDKCSKIDQKFIVRDNLDMCLGLKRRASEGNAGDCDHIYSVRHVASSHKGIYGLYIFPLRKKWPMLFQKPGIFTFSFSVCGLKDIEFQHEVQVEPSAGVGRWKVLNHDKNELYRVRVGSNFKQLSIACYDRYNEHIPFTSVPKLVMKLSSSGKTLAQVCSKKVNLTPDKSTMKIKEFFISSSELDDIRPNYDAMLHISTPDEALSVAFPCQVLPGTPKKIIVHPTKLRKQLLPGQILEELTLEVCDEYGNHVKEDESILISLDGLSFQDGSGRRTGIDCLKKVDANSRVDLSNALKVSRGYGKKVLLSVISKNDVIFQLHFHTERRELRAVQKVFKNCEAGSLLENIEFEITDSEGEVDETIHDEEKHGQSHTLQIKSNSFCIDDSVRYSFDRGHCTIPSIPVPDNGGVFVFSAVHSRYPELKSTIEVHVVEKTLRENPVDVGNPKPLARSLFENERIPQMGSSEILLNQVVASPSQVAENFSCSVLNPQLQENPDSATNHEVVGNPILLARRSSEHEQILLDSPSLKESHVRKEPFSPRSKGFESPINDVGNPMLSARRSSEHEQILPDSPSLKESQVRKESFSPRRSKGFESPINDTPVLMTPKLEHAVAQGAISGLGKLSGSSSTLMFPEKLEDDLADSGMKKLNHERNLEKLNLSQKLIEQEVSALLGPDLGNASSLRSQQSTLEQIQSRTQSAAALVCTMPEEKRRQLNIVGATNHEVVGNPILLARRSSEHEQILLDSPSLKESHVRKEPFSPRSKGFESPINDVGNPMLSARRSSEHEQILPDSPSLKESQVRKESFSPRRSKGFESPINDTPVLMTPKLEHAVAQGAISGLGKLSGSSSTLMFPEKLEDDLADSGMKKLNHERNLEKLNLSQKLIEQEVSALLGPDLGNASSLRSQQSTLEQIQSRTQSAAALVCTMPEEKRRQLNIVGATNHEVVGNPILLARRSSEHEQILLDSPSLKESHVRKEPFSPRSKGFESPINDVGNPMLSARRSSEHEQILPDSPSLKESQVRKESFSPRRSKGFESPINDTPVLMTPKLEHAVAQGAISGLGKLSGSSSTLMFPEKLEDDLADSGMKKLNHERNLEKLNLSQKLIEQEVSALLGPDLGNASSLRSQQSTLEQIQSRTQSAAALVCTMPEEKRRQLNIVGATNHEVVGNPILLARRSSEHEQILLDSPSLKESHVRKEPFSPRSKGFESPINDVGNPMLSARRSSEHEQILPDSPSLKESQVRKESFSPRRSKGFESPINDTPVLMTPKLEHAVAQGAISGLGKLSGSSSTLMFPEKLEDDLADSGMKKLNHERNLEKLNLSQKLIEQEVSALLGPDLGNASSLRSQQSTLEQIQSRTQSAAALVCTMPEEKRRQLNIVGATNHEVVGNPILLARRSSEHEQILLDSPSLKESHVRKEPFSPRSKGFESPINDVGNPMLSAQRSSEHEQILPDSPSLKESQVRKESFSPRRSKGFESPINDTPVLMTPKLEHAVAQGAISGLGKLSGSSSTLMFPEKLEDDLADTGMKKLNHERNLEKLNLSQKLIEQEVSGLQALLGPDLGNASSLRSQQSTLEQIQSRTQSAAALVCTMPEEKRRQLNIVGATNHEVVGNPILLARRSSEHEQILLDSPSLKESHVRKEPFSPRSKGFESPINDVGNPMLSARRSSEHEQILPDSPSLKESQVRKESFSPRRSKGFESPINDTPVLMTPKLEHAVAQGAISGLGKLSGSSSTLMFPEKLEDDLADSGMKKFNHERNLGKLNLSQKHIEQEVSRLQALLGPDLGNASSLRSQQSTLEQIQSRTQSAAALVCTMPEEKRRQLNIVGVVALLGTVESIELSRMLAQYLGEDQMLAVVCRNYAASDLGRPINGGYLAFCLDDIRPSTRKPSIDPEEILPLPQPTLPDGTVPRGFLGYAVNLIRIEPSYLHWRTKSGYGLRETLFYRLFGNLHVYRDRECLTVAQSCTKAGAVSLDGGMVRENGLICRGNWEAKILFPVMHKAASADNLRILARLEEKKLQLEKTKQRVAEELDAYCKSKEKFETCLGMYKSYKSQQEPE